MKKPTPKPNLLVELINRKIEAQKTGSKAESFSKYVPNKPRNYNNSNVGAAWGPRKGN